MLASRERAAGEGGHAGTVKFRLSPRAPFRLDLTAWTLRRQAENAVDRWDGSIYRRILAAGRRRPSRWPSRRSPPESPVLQVAVTREPRPPRASNPRWRRSWSGYSACMSILVTSIGLPPAMRDWPRWLNGPAACAFPRFPTVFEGLINGIACQQVSLPLGIVLLSRLSGSYGPAGGEGKAAAHAFPRPEDLAVLDPRALRPLGFSYQKSRAIVEAARAVCEKQLDLDRLNDVPDERSRGAVGTASPG